MVQADQRVDKARSSSSQAAVVTAGTKSPLSPLPLQMHWHNCLVIVTIVISSVSTIFITITSVAMPNIMSIAGTVAGGTAMLEQAGNTFLSFFGLFFGLFSSHLFPSSLLSFSGQFFPSPFLAHSFLFCWCTIASPFLCGNTSIPKLF